MRQEARPLVGGRGVDVSVPDYLAEVVATISHLARRATPRQSAQSVSACA